MLQRTSIIFMLLLSTTLFAQYHEAKELFNEANCLECHSADKLKPRKDKINNFSKLRDMVDACAQNSGAGWFEEEVLDVSKYLNKERYKFKDTK